MSAVNCMILFLFTTCWCNFGSCESSRIAECCGNCISKVPDKQLCNRTCTQLIPGNYSQASNIPAVPPVPDAPILLSSGYFTFTLDWGSYSHTKYNATPVVYVLEVTRHTNITDPFIILPHLQIYHTTTNTTFTIPEEFITKTANFSFRLAVVSFQATSHFSDSSPLYQTNSSCTRLEHPLSMGEFPCRMFNVRLNFTALPIPFERPKLFTTLYWELPRALHDVLTDSEVEVDLSRSPRQHCYVNGLLSHSHYPLPLPNVTTDELKFPSDKQFYFGCSYDFKIRSQVKLVYETKATFDIPDCIHGFCFCEKTFPAKPKESDHIRVEFLEDKLYINKTTAHVTWSTEDWDKKPAYFKIDLSKCENICPLITGKHRDVVVADLKGVNNTYNFSYSNLTDGTRYRALVSAFDSSGCVFSKIAVKLFHAVIPKTAPTTKATALPTTIATMVPTTKPATSAAPTIESTRVSTAAGNRMSSGTMAAIVVPIILFAVAGLLLAVFWFCRKQKKPFRRHFDDRASYPRNVGDVPSSPYANDRFDLVVNLPSKSERGLELNPAYVEQRIQEAVETGEADEFEFGFHRLELKRVLGKGAFGKVFLAEAYGIGGSENTSLVAVKVLNDKANEDEVEDFKMEINFMKTIGHHENVVTMLGCCTLYPPLCLVVECVPHGDLLHYLRDLRKTFEQQYRKLQGDDVKGLKNEEKSSTSQTLPNGSESTSTSSYSHRPLVPSASDTKKHETFLDSSERPKFNRSTSLKSLKALSVLNTVRRASEIPSVHYVARDPADASSNTETTTLAIDSKEASDTKAASAMSLDGALDSGDLQSFAYQIANGMAYLSGREIVHRDLAARNILVGDDKVLKISDFGLSREGIYVKRSTGKIPLRWLSIEAMRDRIYSTTSDVWAFGIVLWEICTLGGFPYPTINDRDLLEFLLEGERMEKPTNCTDEIYQIMLGCWSRECEDRPTFQSLKEQLFDMQKEEKPYVNVDPSQDFTLPPTAGRDSVGNLITFSDGTFSANQLLSRDQSHAPRDVSPISDKENAGYESSNGSENFSVSFGDPAEGNFIHLSPLSRKPRVDGEDMNPELLV